MLDLNISDCYPSGERPMYLKHWQAQQEKQKKSPAAPKKVRRQKARRAALRRKLHAQLAP